MMTHDAVTALPVDLAGHLHANLKCGHARLHEVHKITLIQILSIDRRNIVQRAGITDLATVVSIEGSVVQHDRISID
jgi:hypothetical protein